MNCSTVGKLIKSLRKEKAMTQLQLAKAMNISDKTISKWERGLGCPDVTLLKSLSEILRVNIESILTGDLDPNALDGGNMKRINFYVCPICGNTMTATGEADISCCGRRLEPMIPKAPDQRHEVQVQAIENDYFAAFNHEMSKTHFIRFVAYVSMDRVLLIKLYPEQMSEVRFPKMFGGKLYYCCSQEGLWVQSI